MSASAILKLQKVGFTPEQVEALADFMDDRAATKADLLEVEHRLDLKIGAVQADIAAIRAESKADIGALRADMHSGFQILEQRMTIRLGTMLIALAGILIAAIRYLPQHP